MTIARDFLIEGIDNAFGDAIADMCRTWLSELTADAGLQIAGFHNGRIVFSMWAGEDPFSGQPVRRDTLFPILSATKGIASIILLYLHDRGYFHWTDPVVNYWPSFGRQGKQSCTIADVLSHRAGVPHVTAHWSRWADRAYMTQLIEDAAPLWPPGRCYGYHGGSWGVIVDELVRIWTGSETGELLRTSLLDSLPEAQNCYIGLPLEEYHRVARLLYVEPAQLESDFPHGPLGENTGYNAANILTTCQSSGGGVASAESLAAVYSLIATQGRGSHGRYWSAATQAYATKARNNPSCDAPAVRPELRLAWGMGFIVSPSAGIFGTSPLSPQTAGHAGASGALGYGDPRSGLSVALTMNGIGGHDSNFRRFRQFGDLLSRAARLGGLPGTPRDIA